MMIGCTFLTTALVAITAAEFLVQLTVKSLSPYFYIGLCSVSLYPLKYEAVKPILSLIGGFS